MMMQNAYAPDSHWKHLNFVEVCVSSYVEKWTMANFLFVCDSRNYNWPGVVYKAKGTV